MEIISDLSKICSGIVILCKANEVIMPAYVLNNFNDIYYLYVQNRIMAIEIQHTVENDPITGDLYDEWYQIDSTLICDYCIIPEADYILKYQRRCKNANRLFLYCKDTAILSFTLLLLNHTLQSVKIVVF